MTRQAPLAFAGIPAVGAILVVRGQGRAVVRRVLAVVVGTAFAVSLVVMPSARSYASTVAAPKYDANHLMVLSYHATPTPQSTPPATNPYWTDSAHLADQFAMLRSLGYTSVTVAQVVAWQGHHGVLPPRPVLITFLAR